MSTLAQAAISGTGSLEWRVCQAKIVAVGRLKEVKTVVWGQVLYEDCVLEVSENIKGSDAKNISFTFRHVTANKEKWKYPKGEVLVFLSVWEDRFTDEEAASSGFADPYYETRMHKRLVLMGRGDRLDGYSIIPLTNPLADVWDKEMQPVTDKDEMLTICRKWNKSPITHSIEIDVPFDTPLYKRYYAMSAVLFVVPAEEKFRPRFLADANSTDKYKRSRAAWELSKFPGDETEAALRKLLDDNTETIWLALPDSIAEIKYEIRSHAYHALKHLGKSVPENLILERKPTEDEQRKHRVQHWENIFKQVAQADWTIKSIEVLEVRKPADKAERETVSILVKISAGASDFDVTILPWGWKIRELPGAQFMGFNSDLAQSDTRAFFLKGNPGKDVIERLKKQLRLR